MALGDVIHLSHGEMSITLDDVSCLLHFRIMGKCLDHNKINKDDTLEMMVDYMRADPWDSIKELEST